MKIKKEQFGYYKKILDAVASKSTCDRKHVGAIIVKDKCIISTGYNGAARGLPHCKEVNHYLQNGHCQNTIHAEINAVLTASRNGININDCIMFCSSKPCYNCMKTLINSGIKTCYYFKEYKDDKQKFFEKNKYCKFVKVIKCVDC